MKRTFARFPAFGRQETTGSSVLEAAMHSESLRIAYILKMYPRFSETFIVNEILAHEAAGEEIEIFSLRAPVDGRFHEDHARVRAPVSYVKSGIPKATRLWAQIHAAGARFPALWALLAEHPDLEVDDLYQSLLVAQMVQDRGYSLLHAHFGSIATTVTRLVSKLTGVPYVFTAHAKDIYHESVDPADLGAKLADAAATITVSDFNIAYLRDFYGDAATKVNRVYNGMNLDKLRYETPAERPRRIVGVGRLIEKKGFGDLIDACAVLAGRGSEFDCEIIGAGALESDLRAQIKGHGLEEQVKLVGPRPQEEVMAHMQTAAAFAAPCVIGVDGNRDGLPTVLLEAMALGVPCISTDVTGIPEVVRDDETGRIVSQHSPDELADALELLLDHSELRVRYARAARNLIEEEFDIRRNAATIRRIYRSAVRPPAISPEATTVADDRFHRLQEAA